jgi:large subunit ribosomal protein L4
MKVNLYNQKGELLGQKDLPKEIAEIKENPDLIHQVVVSQLANQRNKIAQTKDRSEVSGGGRKPWRQKGLGRARHGSIRSPLWRKGGVVFGPRKERNFKKKIPKKMKRKALLMVLKAKAKNDSLFLFENLKIEKPKTKIFAQMVENWRKKIKNLKEGKILIALPKLEKNLLLAARNLPKVKTVEVRNLNCLDLLSFKHLILTPESLEEIKKVFIKE